MPARHPNDQSKSRVLAEASTLWQAKRFDAALVKYQQAVRNNPNDFRTLIEASRALGKRYRIEQSKELLERAAQLGNGRPEIHHAIGETYVMLRRAGQAESHFRQACQLDRHPRSMYELAKLCERRHALTEADELLTQVLRAEPSFLAAQVLRCRIQRRNGNVEMAEATLTRLSKAMPANASGLIEVYGELSTLLDSIGEHERAWQAALSSKAIHQRSETTAWHAGQFVTKRFGQMVEDITPQHFKDWRADMVSEPVANLAVMTGFPRSGTTLLERVLDAHPSAVCVEEFETFNDEALVWLGNDYSPDTPILKVLQEQNSERIQIARCQYMRAMESIAGGQLNEQVLIDKNPAFNLLIPAFRRVFPETKLIVALRDPRDVVLSCFLQQFPLNPVSVWFLTLERTVERYLIDMQAWHKIREMTDDWIEVGYEDVVADLAKQSARTLQALGLPWHDDVLNYRERIEVRQINSPSYDAVAKPVYGSSIGRWRNYSKQLEPVLDKLAPVVKALGYEL